MKSIKTSLLLKKLRDDAMFLLEQIESIHEHTPDELLETNDGPNRWNSLQVLEHLNTYYRFYIPAIEQAIEKSAIPFSAEFKSGLLGNYFTNSMLPKDGMVKNKMKAMKSHSPSLTLNKTQVLEEFLRWQRKWILLLDKAQQADLNAIKIPISITSLIKLKLGDVFQFINAHNQRHWIQLETLLGRLPVLLN